MLRATSQLINLAAFVSLLLGIWTKPASQNLTLQEMRSVNGGETYYCAYPIVNPTHSGCQQCVLAHANWLHILPNGDQTHVPVYKKCTNTSLDYVCRVQTYPGSPNPYCTKTNHSCGTTATAFTDNICTGAAPGYWTENGQFPLPNIVCDRSYHSATTGPTMGVNCTNVTPGDH